MGGVQRLSVLNKETTYLLTYLQYNRNYSLL